MAVSLDGLTFWRQTLRMAQSLRLVLRPWVPIDLPRYEDDALIGPDYRVRHRLH